MRHSENNSRDFLVVSRGYRGRLDIRLDIRLDPRIDSPAARR